MQTLSQLYPALDPHVLHFVDRMIDWAGMNRSETLRVLDSCATREEVPQRFLDAGAHWARRANEASAEGRRTTAGEWAHQAFGCYRVADFYFSKDGSGRLDAYDLAVEAFWQTAAYQAEPPEAVELVLDGQAMPGYKVVPRDRQEPVPAVVLIFGADGNKEEHYWGNVLPAVRRGMAVLVIDGPAQGTSLRRNHIHARPDMEVFGTACLDLLRSDRRIDADRVGLVGSSFGGYSAIRSLAFEPRFRACLIISALHNALEGIWETYPPIRPQLRYNLGVDSDAEAVEKLRQFDLGGLLGGIDRPVALHHGGADALVPPSQAQRVYDELGGEKLLKIWEGGNHNVHNFGFEAFPEMWDWMARQLQVEQP